MEILIMLKETLIAVGGIGVGYFLATSIMQKKYDERLDVEIAKTREFFGSQAARVDEAVEAFSEYAGDKPSPDVEIVDVVSAFPSELTERVESPAAAMKGPAASTITDLTGLSPVERSEKLEQIANKTQYNTPPKPTKATEMVKLRAEMIPRVEPYVITFAEFDANETEAAQVSVSFFAGDGVVVDEVNEIVSAERVEETLGVNNLNKFGTNTDDPDMDPNILYIRCERFMIDFEVARSPGKYTVEVLGEEG